MLFSISFFLYIFGILTAIVTVIITLMFWNLSHWKRKNIFHVPPSFPFGNAGETVAKRKSIFDVIGDLYNQARSAKQKHAGLYIITNPQYMPIDPDMVKNILQNDFQHFVDRGMYYNEKHDPLSAHLFSLEGTKWKNLRARLSPTFTSGKMKMMLPIVSEITARLIRAIDDEPVKQGIEMKELMARLTTDIIGSIAFGIECNCIENPDAEFRKYAKILLEESQSNLVIRSLTTTFPNMMRSLGVRILPKEFTTFFINAVREIVDYREKNNVKRKDFLDLLIQLKNTGKVDEGVNTEVDEKNRLSLNTLMAQAYVFYLGGFETTSTTLSFCLYELCRDQGVQDTLRSEILDVLRKHGNNLTYEALGEMKYMDMVLNETLRKYPPLRVLVRECTQKYRIPGTGTIIEKGTKVMVPVRSIHYDPEYYPNPEVFNPSRFSDEVKRKRHPFTFLPFGEGPRICIGMRFGVMQSKCALVLLLKNYRFKLNPQTSVPLKISPKKFLTAVDGGIWVDVSNVE